MPQPPNPSAETNSDPGQSSDPLVPQTLSRMPTVKYEEITTNLTRTYAIRLFHPGDDIALTPEEDASSYNNTYQSKGPE